MKTLCEIFVAGDPKGQPRQRHFAMKIGNRYSARSYDPGTSDGWKGLIALAIKPHLQAAPVNEPLRVDIAFYFRRPKRLLRKCDPDGIIPYTAKPDRDNLDKAVLDAITQCGFWADDALVCAGTICKWYVTRDGRPGAKIKISTMSDAVEA